MKYYEINLKGTKYQHMMMYPDPLFEDAGLLSC
jgi:hypothetical protein